MTKRVRNDIMKCIFSGVEGKNICIDSFRECILGCEMRGKKRMGTPLSLLHGAGVFRVKEQSGVS